MNNSSTYNQFFAKYYDFLYVKKDYQKESLLIERILCKYLHEKPSRLLDVGCGTGIHAIHLAKRGYSVIGVDISKDMISIANKKAELFPELDLTFKYCDIKQLKNRFEFIYSMFNVINCLDDVEDLINFFDQIRSICSGVYLFDCWNYDSILINKPISKTNTISTPEGIITKSVVPVLDLKNYLCYLNCQFDINGQSHKIKHRIRLFKHDVIMNVLKKSGFSVIGCFKDLEEGVISNNDPTRTYIVKI